MIYMHERVGYVVLRQQLTFSCVSKTSPVDNQENDHTATGSNDVHLTTYRQKYKLSNQNHPAGKIHFHAIQQT